MNDQARESDRELKREERGGHTWDRSLPGLSFTKQE